MYAFPIGVIVDSFRLPLAQAWPKPNLSARRVSRSTTEGTWHPKPDPAKRRELRRFRTTG